MMKDILQKVNKKTLIVSDVDGTILDNNGELDVETRNIINKYIKYGSFTIATGRSYTMACKILNGIKFDLPIITNDGACIYTPQGKMLKCFTIEQNKLLNKALDILYKTHTILSYSQYEGSEKVFWLGDLNKLTKIYFESRAGDNRFTQVENVKELFQGNVISISFIEDYKNSLKLRNQLGKIGIRDVFINKDAYIDGMYWVKIKNSFATKGYAMKFLATMLNLESTISIGNDSNDLDMLQQSEISICVENATDQIKQNAMYIIDSNINNGVGKLLKNIMGG